MKVFNQVAAMTVLAGVAAQQQGTLTQEKHPVLTTSTCTKSGGCTKQQQAVTIDANWRWTHKKGEATNCYTGNTWDASLCPDPVTCAQNCAIDGADAEYEGTYGVHANGDELQLNFVTQGPYSKNIGSRVFLLESEDKYQMLKLKNKEFSFDVDDSELPCGLNGALYFVQMDANGGMGTNDNKAGAKYGTGYCDAQCPHDVKFIDGKANSEDWIPAPNDPNSGKGKVGTCCTEMDIWEANSISTAYTPHACATDGYHPCTGVECGDGDDRFKGVCDKNGCDLQTYRLGNKKFWGPGSEFTVDSSKKVTVTTQFITEDGTDTGALSEIRRFYVQDGKRIDTPKLTVGTEGQFDSITADFCKAAADYFADGTNFLAKGGLVAMDKALTAGMTLVMSLWDDHDVNMLWLDSTYPVSGGVGAERGTCATTSGVPADVERDHADAHVKFSNVRWGEMDATVSYTM